MPLKIINLFAENIKRLKAVEICPKDNTVIISGKNEQGKSSILDSIWLACKYSAASKVTPNPIRDGTDHAMIVLDLGDYKITRQFRINGDSEITTRLTVERANGDVVKSPQSVIDGFIGSLSFDPLEFMRRPAKEQREMLADVAKLNLAELDAQHDSLYNERTELNREVKSLSANIANIAPPTSAAEVNEVNSNDLLKELSELQEHLKYVIVSINEEAALKKKIEALKVELAAAEEEYHQKYESPILTLDTSYYDRKIKDVTDQITKAADINARAKEVRYYRDIVTKIEAAKNRLSEIETSLNSLKDERTKAIEAADLPIDGLTIEEDGVLFKGQPLTQLSSSQQIKISMVLAMAANSELRVIRIKDGSLLDSENLELIRDIAKNGDFQVWIECVDSSGKVGFYIENGEVAAVNE